MSASIINKQQLLSVFGIVLSVCSGNAAVMKPVGDVFVHGFQLKVESVRPSRVNLDAIDVDFYPTSQDENAYKAEQRVEATKIIDRILKIIRKSGKAFKDIRNELTDSQVLLNVYDVDAEALNVVQSVHGVHAWVNKVQTEVEWKSEELTSVVREEKLLRVLEEKKEKFSKDQIRSVLTKMVKKMPKTISVLAKLGRLGKDSEEAMGLLFDVLSIGNVFKDDFTEEEILKQAKILEKSADVSFIRRAASALKKTEAKSKLEKLLGEEANASLSVIFRLVVDQGKK